MIEFIHGDLETADLLIYGDKSAITQETVETQRTNFMSNLPPKSTTFFTNVLKMQALMAKNRAIQMASGAFRKIKSLWDEDIIRELNTVGDFQHAPNSMKRYIMAEPIIRALWLKQLCDGYNDYSEFNRYRSGDDLKEYRQVMNGIITCDDNNVEIDHEYVIYNHNEDYLDPQDTLTADDQLIMFNTWQNLQSIIAKGEEDPTSETNDWLSV